MEPNLTEPLFEVARNAGIDLVGVSPIERFEGIDAQHHPASIFPETRSVVALAKRITRGCLRGVEEGTNLAIYKTYAMNWVPNRFLAYAAVAVASFLEDNRCEAVPLPDLPPEVPPMGIPVRPGLPAPNVMVDFVDAGVRCGLGEIGLMGELMTPQFGHRQRLVLILTDAEIDPSPLCQQQVCLRCGACATACPFDAVDEGSLKEVRICGKVMSVASIDERACAYCRNGAFANPSHRTGRPDRLAAMCLRSCALMQDQRDRLAKPLINPFRDKAPWVIGRDGIPRLAEQEQ
jgi:epoxyqueuosine reductase QueG